MLENLFVVIIVSFIVGVLTKYVDMIYDNKIPHIKHIEKMLGIVYGILIGVVGTIAIETLPLIFATLIGLTAALKINRIGHILGVLSALFVVIFFGFEQFSIALLVVFIAVNIIDEISNNMADKRKNTKLSAFFVARPFLEIASFSASYVTGQWVIWFVILSYDIGYNLTIRLFK
jgi:hypothetical protein